MGIGCICRMGLCFGYDWETMNLINPFLYIFGNIYSLQQTTAFRWLHLSVVFHLRWSHAMPVVDYKTLLLFFDNQPGFAGISLIAEGSTRQDYSVSHHFLISLMDPAAVASSANQTCRARPHSWVTSGYMPRAWRYKVLKAFLTSTRSIMRILWSVVSLAIQSIEGVFSIN